MSRIEKGQIYRSPPGTYGMEVRVISTSTNSLGYVEIEVISSNLVHTSDRLGIRIDVLKTWELIEPVSPEERRKRLLATLENIANHPDVEKAHLDADKAILEYINDPEVSAAFERIEKLYG